MTGRSLDCAELLRERSGGLAKPWPRWRTNSKAQTRPPVHRSDHGAVASLPPKLSLSTSLINGGRHLLPLYHPCLPSIPSRPPESRRKTARVEFANQGPTTDESFTISTACRAHHMPFFKWRQPPAYVFGGDGAWDGPVSIARLDTVGGLGAVSSSRVGVEEVAVPLQTRRCVLEEAVGCGRACFTKTASVSNIRLAIP